MQIQKIPKTNEELLAHFIKERDGMAEFRDELNRDFSEQKIDIIKEKRVFYQNILIASTTLLGLASVFSSFSNSGIYLPYLLFGLGLHLGVICVVVMYLREVLDQELEGLTNSHDRYAKILQTHILLLEQYQNAVSQAEPEMSIEKTLLAYTDELQKHSTIAALKAENDLYDQQREERMGGGSYLEFYGEIISFLFITGSAFVLLAISGEQFSKKSIAIGLLLSFLISFTDFLTKYSKLLFHTLTFLKKERRWKFLIDKK